MTSQQLDSTMFISDICKLIYSGGRASPDDEKALKLFMVLPENLPAILQAAWQEPSIAICFKSFTQTERRTKAYFKDFTECPANFLEQVLQNIVGAPLFITEHLTNVYLTIEGELLALMIDLDARSSFISEYLAKIAKLEIPLQIKVHFLIKIMSSCLDQLKLMQDKLMPNTNKKTKIVNYITRYAPLIIDYLDTATNIVMQNFNIFENPYYVVANLLEVYDSFLSSMNQQEDMENTLDERMREAKVYVMGWEEQSFQLWVKFSCSIVSKIVKEIGKIANLSDQKIFKANQIGCQCVTLLSHLSALVENSPTSNEQLSKRIQNIIMIHFLDQFLSNFLEKPVGLNELSVEFHVAVLKLFTKERFMMNTISHMYLPYQEERPRWSMHITMIENYCQYVIDSYYFYFTSFQECPIGLSVKLMFMLTSSAISSFSKFVDADNTSLELLSHDMDERYRNFYEQLLFQKMIDPSFADTENEELYSNGKDWEDFFLKTLNYYFEDFATYVPIYEPNDDLDFRLMRLPTENAKQRLFSENQTQPVQFKEYEKKTRSKFKLLKKLISSITFKNMNLKKDILNKYVYTNQHELEQSPIDQSDEQSFQSQQIIKFSNVVPLLSCIRALMRNVPDISLRGQLFYDFYLIGQQINIISYVTCQHKAIICKLFIVQTFFQEIMPIQYIQKGEQASDTLQYLSQSIGETIQDLISEAMDVFFQCLKLAVLDDEEEACIIDYAITIMERISDLICQRAFYVYQAGEYCSSQKLEKIGKKLQLMYESVLIMDVRYPKAYRKLFKMSAHFIQICGPTCMYNIYDKLKKETIDNPQINLSNKSQYINLYFSGLTGILDGLPRCLLFKDAAEMMILELMANEIQIQESMVENYLHFLDTIMSIKLQPSNLIHDSIGPLIHDFLYDHIEQLTRWVHRTEHERLCVHLYMKLGMINNLCMLHPLPDFIDLQFYPEVLNIYYENIPRVADLSILEKYAGMTINWTMSFLEAKVDRREDYKPNIDQLGINFRFKAAEKLFRIALLCSILLKIPKQQILHQFDISKAEIDCIYYNANQDKDTGLID